MESNGAKLYNEVTVKCSGADIFLITFPILSLTEAYLIHSN